MQLPIVRAERAHPSCWRCGCGRSGGVWVERLRVRCWCAGQEQLGLRFGVKDATTTIIPQRRAVQVREASWAARCSCMSSLPAPRPFRVQIGQLRTDLLLSFGRYAHYRAASYLLHWSTQPLLPTVLRRPRASSARFCSCSPCSPGVTLHQSYQLAATLSRGPFAPCCRYTPLARLIPFPISSHRLAQQHVLAAAHVRLDAK